MSRSCSICTDARRQDIDFDLAAGKSGRNLAIEYGLSADALKRHARNHAAVASGAPLATNDPLTELVDAIRPRALDGANAGAIREYRLALAALTERSVERPTYDVRVDPEFLRIRSALLEALKPFPEARLAAADALRGLRDA